MCGIAGILSPDRRELITKMNEAMIHRGPDDAGILDDGDIALGQRRLSIIDIEGGHQPIANEDGSLQLVCNGEIYNSPQLRQELQAAGHRFRTRTDVEVILHLYEDLGRACVTKLRGMFAFAIWDAKQKTLLLARDHMGQKPLFYCEVGGAFLFASEVKAILATGLVEPEMNLDGLWHYVSMRYLPDRYTLFRGIEKLQAATTLARCDGRSSLEKYWCPDFRSKLSGNLESVTDQLDELLRETVSLHLLSDVQVGAFVSGGIDSSLVASLAAEFSEAPVPSFSIGVRDQRFNELPFARQVVRRYGMQAHERVVDPDLVQIVPQMIRHLDEPSDPFGFGVYLVSQMAAEQVKVVLGGDGGDENFAGYDRFANNRFVDLYAALPEVFRRRFMARAISHIPESFGYKSLAQKATWLNEMSYHAGGRRYAHAMSFLRFTPAGRGRLFSADAARQVTDADSVAKILRHFEADNVEDLVDRMLFTDLMTRMPDHLLSIVDRMSMAHSLENRSPLVDHKVVEFAASVPAAMKLKGRDLKHILKRVAARYLPTELITRQKQGFSFPLGTWMRTDLRPCMEGMLGESRFVALGIFDGDEVDRLWQEHASGRVDHNYRLWILLNLELWYRLYFEGETPASLTDRIQRLSAGAA